MYSSDYLHGVTTQEQQRTRWRIRWIKNKVNINIEQDLVQKHVQEYRYVKKWHYIDKYQKNSEVG